ncbi:alpha-hydroxy-acid oxidizing protein, partial [Vibrio fluvialis]|nr:alpha-hydroxy-acid oxidizing protein [Vibrio fluvialis]
ADLVAIGRPVIYGLALGGSTGVQQVFDFFKKELEMVMQLAGTQTIADIRQAKLRDNHYM